MAGISSRAGADSGDSRLEPHTYSLRELLGRLGPGDHIPAPGLDHLEELGVALRRADAQLAALPLAEPHLAPLGYHDRLEPGAGHERNGGLRRPPQRGDEQRGEPLLRQPLRDRLGLLLALGRKRRVALPLERLEGLARHRSGGRAVAYEHYLCGIGGWGEGALGVGLGDGGSLSGTPLGGGSARP